MKKTNETKENPYTYKEYEINCAMGNINDSVKNLQYWYDMDNTENMEQVLKRLKAGVERLQKALEIKE